MRAKKKESSGTGGKKGGGSGGREGDSRNGAGVRDEVTRRDPIKNLRPLGEMAATKTEMP